MDHKVMDAVEQVKKELVSDGQKQSVVDANIKKLIYLIICRI